MYSNLLTAGGESNHVLLPGTLPLTDIQEHVVNIVATATPALRSYQQQGLWVPLASFQVFLRDYPETIATVALDGQVLEVGPGELPGVLMGGPGWFESKFGHFRALDLDGRKSCLRTWGVAH